MTESINREKGKELEVIGKRFDDARNEETITGRKIATRASHEITKLNPKYNLTTTT